MLWTFFCIVDPNIILKMGVKSIYVLIDGQPNFSIVDGKGFKD